MTTTPLKQLVSIVDDQTNCGKDVAQLIVSFDTDYKQLKLDLSKAMQDRVDRKLEYKKHRDEDIIDYQITTIVHGTMFRITFATFLRHVHFGITFNKEYPDKGESLVVEINYNTGDDRLPARLYPRKSIHKLIEQEFPNYHK